MEYIDLTHKIKNELSEYPGDPKTKLNYFKKKLMKLTVPHCLN